MEMENMQIGTLRPIRLGAMAALLVITVWATYEGWIALPHPLIIGLLIGIAFFVVSLATQEKVKKGVIHALALAATTISAAAIAVAVALNWSVIGQINWLDFGLFIICLLVALGVIWWATSESKRD